MAARLRIDFADALSHLPVVWKVSQPLFLRIKSPGRAIVLTNVPQTSALSFPSLGLFGSLGK
jgi:hypothetical protein